MRKQRRSAPPEPEAMSSSASTETPLRLLLSPRSEEGSSEGPGVVEGEVEEGEVEEGEVEE